MYNAKHILVNYDEYESRKYAGDLAAVDTLVDLESAIEQARLTYAQKLDITKVYVLGYDQDEVAEQRGVSQSAIAQSLRLAVAKIQKVFDGWDYE